MPNLTELQNSKTVAGYGGEWELAVDSNLPNNSIPGLLFQIIGANASRDGEDFVAGDVAFVNDDGTTVKNIGSGGAGGGIVDWPADQIITPGSGPTASSSIAASWDSGLAEMTISGTPHSFTISGGPGPSEGGCVILSSVVTVNNALSVQAAIDSLIANTGTDVLIAGVGLVSGTGYTATEVLEAAAATVFGNLIAPASIDWISMHVYAHSPALLGSSDYGHGTNFTSRTSGPAVTPWFLDPTGTVVAGSRTIGQFGFGSLPDEAVDGFVVGAAGEESSIITRNSSNFVDVGIYDPTGSTARLFVFAFDLNVGTGHAVASKTFSYGFGVVEPLIVPAVSFEDLLTIDDLRAGFGDLGGTGPTEYGDFDGFGNPPVANPPALPDDEIIRATSVSSPPFDPYAAYTATVVYGSVYENINGVLQELSNNTAAPTDAEIKTAYENNADTNAYTDAEKTTVSTQSGTNTGDMSDAAVKTAYENNADTNALTDSEKTAVGNLSGTNTGDMSDAQVKTAYENNADTNAFTDAEQTIVGNVVSFVQTVIGSSVGYAWTSTTPGTTTLLFTYTGTASSVDLTQMASMPIGGEIIFNHNGTGEIDTLYLSETTANQDYLVPGGKVPLGSSRTIRKIATAFYEVVGSSGSNGIVNESTVSGSTVSIALQTNASAISGHDTSIGTNITNIGTNATNIGTNATNIAAIGAKTRWDSATDNVNTTTVLSNDGKTATVTYTMQTGGEGCVLDTFAPTLIEPGITMWGVEFATWQNGSDELTFQMHMGSAFFGTFTTKDSGTAAISFSTGGSTAAVAWSEGDIVYMYYDSSTNKIGAIHNGVDLGVSSGTVVLDSSAKINLTMQADAGTSLNYVINMFSLTSELDPILPGARGWGISDLILEDHRPNITQLDETVRTAAFTALPNRRYYCDVSGPMTVTLPATPVAGDVVELVDYDGAVGTGSPVADLTVARNSSNIDGAASDLTVSTADALVRLEYIDVTQGWKSKVL